MGSLVVGNGELCKEIAESLGIKHCTSLKIEINRDCIVHVKAEFYPEEEGLMKFHTIIKEYTLTEKEEK